MARSGRDHNLIIIDAAKEPMIRNVMFGEISEKVARYSPSAVMVVKKYEGGVQSCMNRMMG